MADGWTGSYAEASKEIGGVRVQIRFVLGLWSVLVNGRTFKKRRSRQAAMNTATRLGREAEKQEPPFGGS